ncbi:MAG: hypothetical protein H6581_24270 [Bacteroidia bacterium]|nr:hypothetical protein [Bacteroidia bacterium]
MKGSKISLIICLFIVFGTLTSCATSDSKQKCKSIEIHCLPWLAIIHPEVTRENLLDGPYVEIGDEKKIQSIEDHLLKLKQDKAEANPDFRIGAVLKDSLGTVIAEILISRFQTKYKSNYYSNDRKLIELLLESAPGECQIGEDVYEIFFKDQKY